MPSRRTVLGGVAGLLSALAGCSLLPPPPGEEPHPTRDWLYDPSRFADDWRRYRASVWTPALWDEHRRWLGTDAVDEALDRHRPYHRAFGVETRDVDWELSVGDPGDALPALRVSAAAFDRRRIERTLNTTTRERADDYRTMAMFRAPDRDRAYAVGGDYLVDCRAPTADPDETLRTCIDTQTGRLDRFTDANEHCRRLADALAEDAEFGFEVLPGPESGVLGRGWRRLFDEETTYLKGVVLFEEERPEDAGVGDRLSLAEWHGDREPDTRVDGRLGVLTAECPTETVRLDSAPVVFG
ncbi:hypothetical protein [Halomarina rubra]|uniref:Uncharacterized protein n=1 Tax=Halomarina rubra TaxID=2071873 RepID=A0ABD6AVA7_9EURY|nr:hypothetical protein [Halomarina rubra]